MRRLILGLAVVLLGSAGLATAQPVTMTVGTAVQDGALQFQLVALDSSALNVHVNLSAGDSSAIIASKIKMAVSLDSPFWQVQINGGAVSFLHFSGSTWSYVGVVSGASDTASASLKFSNSCPADTRLAIDPTAKASGSGSGGVGSFLTFSISGAAPYAVVLSPGETAKSIMDGVCQYLSGAGIAYTRLSDTKVYVRLPGLSSSVSVQTNDSGLQGAVSLSDAWDTQSGVIDR